MALNWFVAILLVILVKSASSSTSSFDCCKDSHSSDRLIDCVKERSESLYRNSLHDSVPYLKQKGGQGPSLQSPSSLEPQRTSIHTLLTACSCSTYTQSRMGIFIYPQASTTTKMANLTISTIGS